MTNSIGCIGTRAKAVVRKLRQERAARAPISLLHERLKQPVNHWVTGLFDRINTRCSPTYVTRASREIGTAWKEKSKRDEFLFPWKAFEFHYSRKIVLTWEKCTIVREISRSGHEVERDDFDCWFLASLGYLSITCTRVPFFREWNENREKELIIVREISRLRY